MNKRKRKRILIVLGFLHPAILSGFSRYAREANWILNALPVFHHAVPLDWNADGLLTTNVFRQDLVRYIRKAARLIPTVLHGCDDLRLMVPNVECDEHLIGRMAAKHLLDQDHRHFAYFRYSDNLHAIRRRDGFREALREAGYDCVDLKKISEHGNGAGEWFRKQLAQMPKPLGLFTEDDLLAARAIESATEAGWQVPEHLAVVGCGNIELVCEFGPVPITSISCPHEEQAYQAAAMLDALLSGKKFLEKNVVFPPGGLFARQSTNSVAARLDLVKRALACMSNKQHDPALDARAVAGHCGVSLRVLYREFEKDLRTTPMACLLRMRLRMAKDMLVHGGRKIEDIAEACGFGSLRTFQRAFQRIENQSPLQWKQARR
ncbi:MAG: substrate-binding domain-containing protein [Verrucomicrobia bacterium]|nr:substrate-binding domain-containing protein [Verrucomicrobiota bacterium]